jgi:hypothetical protein
MLFILGQVKLIDEVSAQAEASLLPGLQPGA